ncbi:MAG: ATP-binding cassette domain-containing protein [Candidatus Saccharimonadia bacterium]
MEIALETKGLSKFYNDLVALDSLNLSVKKGEVLGFLGPNGAGKTTTIRAILGLIKPSAGTAEIFGLDVSTHKVETHKKIAYVPGEATFWPGLTGEETLHLLAKLHGKVDEQYQAHLVKLFDFEPSRKVRTYSKGNKQKINLIAALATRAELLILDEPTSGLDPIMEQAFRECILEAKSAGQTVFLSSHILEEVEALCDRIGILRKGKLVELGTLSELRHLSAVTIEATFLGKVPDVSKVSGVKRVKVTGHKLECQVHGSIEPLLVLLSKTDIVKLLSREPSLEELFLTLYGTDEKE